MRQCNSELAAWTYIVVEESFSDVQPWACSRAPFTFKTKWMQVLLLELSVSSHLQSALKDELLLPRGVLKMEDSELQCTTRIAGLRVRENLKSCSFRSAWLRATAQHISQHDVHARQHHMRTYKTSAQLLCFSAYLSVVMGLVVPSKCGKNGEPSAASEVRRTSSRRCVSRFTIIVCLIASCARRRRAAAGLVRLANTQN